MIFRLERFLPTDFGYGSYQDVEYKWEYQTTADVLTLIETDEQGSTQQCIDKWEAEAMLKVLANWYAQYEGKENLKNLLKEELEQE